MLMHTIRGSITATLYPKDCDALALACAKAHETLIEPGDEEVVLLIDALGAAFEAAGQLAELQMDWPPDRPMPMP